MPDSPAHNDHELIETIDAHYQPATPPKRRSSDVWKALDAGHETRARGRRALRLQVAIAVAILCIVGGAVWWISSQNTTIPPSSAGSTPTLSVTGQSAQQEEHNPPKTKTTVGVGSQSTAPPEAWPERRPPFTPQNMGSEHHIPSVFRGPPTRMFEREGLVPDRHLMLVHFLLRAGWAEDDDDDEDAPLWTHERAQRFAEHLELSSAQRADIEDVVDEARPLLIQNQKALDQTQQRLLELMANGAEPETLDTVVDEFTRLEALQIKTELNAAVAIRAVLTPKQQTRVRNFRPWHKRRGHKRPW